MVVGGSEDLTAFDSTRFRRTVEFPAPDDQGLVKESTAFQVFDQGCDRLIGRGSHPQMILFDVLVSVPLLIGRVCGCRFRIRRCQRSERRPASGVPISRRTWDWPGGDLHLSRMHFGRSREERHLRRPGLGGRAVISNVSLLTSVSLFASGAGVRPSF